MYTSRRMEKRKRTLNRSGSPCKTLEKYNCFISFSNLEGNPGYIELPPERTICLYNSDRTSTGAAWTVLKSISKRMSEISDRTGDQIEREKTYQLHRVVRHRRDEAGTYIQVLRIVLNRPWWLVHREAVCKFEWYQISMMILDLKSTSDTPRSFRPSK